MKYLVFLLFVGLAFPAYSQLPQYQAQVFGEDYGIGGGQIFDAFTDTDGFLWVTASTVLQRFDGRNIRKFSFEANISHAMHASEGHIWVLSGQSLWRNRDDWRYFEKVPVDTSGGLIMRGIFEMREIGFFLLTNKGLYRYDNGSGTFAQWHKSIPPPLGRQNIIRLDTCSSTVFYSVKDGICAYDMQSGKARTLPYQIEFMHLMAFTPGLAVLTDYGGISYWFDFDRGEVRRMDAARYGLGDGTQHNMFVHGCVPLAHHRFLVATKFGVCIYDLADDIFTPQRVFTGGVPIENEKSLQRLFQDKTGVFWAVTPISVLAIKPLDHAIGLLRNYHFEAPLQWDNRIVGLVADASGNIWMGGSNGFKKMDPRTGVVRAFLPLEGATDRLSHTSVRGMASDGRNIILGPAYSGVWVFDARTEQYSRPAYASDSVQSEMFTDFIDYIGTLRNGNHVICGRYHPYLMRPQGVDASGRTRYLLDFIHFPGDQTNMNTVTEDSKGRIWFGSEKGVYCLDAQFRLLFELKTEQVFHICEDRPDVMLVGTKKGLRRISVLPSTGKGPVLASIPTPADGVGVVSIYKDQLQRYWLAALNGLYLSDMQCFVFKKFDFTDNIQSQVYSPGALLRAGNGMVFLGGQNGLNYFVPENIVFEDNPLAVTIQSLRLNDGDSVLYQPGPALTFPWQMNTLGFEVVAPYYNNAKKVRYRYRLSGHTKDWVETDGNLFRLANLPAGEYRLEVAASVTGNLWSPAKQALLIHILPPFWQTTWFRLFLLTAIVGLLFFFVRYRENRLRQRQQRQLEMEQLRSTTLQYELEIEQVVNYFNRSISNKNTVDEALWDVAEQCIARLGWEDCVIYLLDTDRQVLVQKAAWGQKSSPQREILSPIEIPLNHGIVGTTAASGRAELVADTQADSRYIVDDAVRGSELAVPILADGRVIGVIDSEHSQKGFFTPWHLQILTAIAALCSNKIMLTRVEEARREVRRQLEEKEKSLLEIEKRAAQIRLMALTNHLNPHFLFNSLTSLNSLI
ncbi:MAG: GAF domain-containing protein, partial [Saprospiraceae bacterium]|nr:GAF domain-containing protein [Saprospiraceae bacterium]